ncbi:hypothetical protein H072_5088 [Dactylellina haptotyla CBS 200.50]|uniref:Uncharacterized protein n=1 Tax=Dactylellina haptotyla (strain CBS 200.50) TaxID=1284197 RepID=S8AIP8_DACHA|nr:hypothetical protein H072_5088 [Dactylellina haptotyla CBS 200.50]
MLAFKQIILSFGLLFTMMQFCFAAPLIGLENNRGDGVAFKVPFDPRKSIFFNSFDMVDRTAVNSGNVALIAGSKPTDISRVVRESLRTVNRVTNDALQLIQVILRNPTKITPV